LKGERDLGGGEGVGSGVAGEGEAAVTVLGGDELGEGSVATRRPGGRVRVLAGGDQGLEDERGGIRIGAGPGLVGEAAVTTLLGVQPPQCAAVPAVHPGGVQGHEHHRGGVGVAGVEAGVIVPDEQEVPATVAVLGGDEMAGCGRRNRLVGGDQTLDGERLGEGLAVTEDTGARVVEAVERAEQVDAAEGGGAEPGGGDRLDQFPAGTVALFACYVWCPTEPCLSRERVCLGRCGGAFRYRLFALSSFLVALPVS